MELKAAKELLDIRAWLARVQLPPLFGKGRQSADSGAWVFPEHTGNLFR